MQFVVQYIRNGLNTADLALSRPSLNLIEADNLEILTRKIEQTLKAGDADDAIIYVPRCELHAERRVNISEIGQSVGSVPKDSGSTVLKESGGAPAFRSSVTTSIPANPQAL